MADFNQRVAVVTGAGAGLGRSHALGLAREGARVVVSDISADAARAVVAEIEALGGVARAAPGDVSDLAAMRALADTVIAEWGQIDILVNNAGILRDKSFGKLEADDFDLVMKVHVTGTFNCIKAVWDHMKERQYGRIVLTSSSSGIFGNFGQTNYGTAKMAMIGMMNCLSIEGARNNIRVNALAPTAATRMTEGLLSEEAADLLTPDSVTPAVLYLVSENAPTKTIMGAGAGVFAVTEIRESEGIFLPEGQRSAEAIASHIDAIRDQSRSRPIPSAFDQTTKYAEIAAQALGRKRSA